VIDSHYDRYKEADFHTAVLADGNDFGCENDDNDNTDCSLINDDSHTDDLDCKYADDDDADHSLIDDDFHDVPFVDQEATKFLDSSTKFEILLYRMIDNHTDAFTKKLHENRIFDIFALGCLSAESIQQLDFDGNKSVGSLRWSYRLQLLQLAEYIRSFIKLGKLINNLNLYQRTDFDVWKLEFVSPSSFTSPSITDTFDHDPLKSISKCAIGTQDAIITSAGVVQSSPDTSIVPDDNHVNSYCSMLSQDLLHMMILSILIRTAELFLCLLLQLLPIG
jgi:hypothetical protein